MLAVVGSSSRLVDTILLLLLLSIAFLDLLSFFGIDFCVSSRVWIVGNTNNSEIKYSKFNQNRITILCVKRSKVLALYVGGVCCYVLLVVTVCCW